MVYDGSVPFSRDEVNVASLERPRTRVLVNVGNPDRAFSLSALPCDGVGQAPGYSPEFARFLVRCGIDSISLNPDTVLKTTQAILEMEKQR